MKAINRTFGKLGEKGSLALEQVLFIGALVTMSVGLFAFYGNIRDYFSGISLGTAPTNLTQGPVTAQGN